MRALTGRPLLGDALLALVLSALTLATLFGQSSDPVGVGEALLAVCTVAPLAARQAWPVLTTAVILVALLASTLVGDDSLPSAGVGLLVAMFTVATLCSRALGAVVYVAGVVVLMVTILASSEPVVWSQAAQSALVLFGAWLLGDATRRWSTRVERSAAQAATAVAEERVRIARELHDVVAHHMSVISLQAGVADYVIETDPAQAKRATAIMGEAGREALAEMRRLLDVLRSEPTADEHGARRPQPGLADLPDLIERTRSAGLPVRSSVAGESVPLSPGADLCAYRVVQEALTNVLRHAPASTRTDVELRYETGRLRVEVRNLGASAPRRSAGHGIRGMRERAELYGGSLLAERTEDGFRVLLDLPLTATVSAPLPGSRL